MDCSPFSVYLKYCAKQIPEKPGQMSGLWSLPSHAFKLRDRWGLDIRLPRDWVEKYYNGKDLSYSALNMCTHNQCAINCSQVPELPILGFDGSVDAIPVLIYEMYRLQQ